MDGLVLIMAAKPLGLGIVTGFFLTAYFCDQINADKRKKLEELDRLEREVRQDVKIRTDDVHQRSLGCGTLKAYGDRFTEGVVAYFKL